MSGFGGTRTEFIVQDIYDQKPIVVSNDVLPITTYLKFDLSSVPESTLFETVNIEDSKLRLFFTSPDDSDATMYVFTVSYCNDNEWNQNDLTWENRPCKNNLEAIDSTLVKEESIPGFIEFDIVGAINKVKEQDKSKITLALDARPILFDIDYEDSEIGQVTNFIQTNWNDIHLSDFRVANESLQEDTFQGRVDREFRGIWKDYLSQDLLNMKYIDVNFIDNNLYSLNYSVTNSHVLRLASSESEHLGHATLSTIVIDYNVGPSVFNDSIIFTFDYNFAYVNHSYSCICLDVQKIKRILIILKFYPITLSLNN